MIILDYNITADQVELLKTAGVHFQRIGHEIGRPEWDDQQEILRYLHRVKRATFCTRDLGFFRQHFCHSNYCTVVVAAPAPEAATLIRRFLRHSIFKTKAQRCGKVVRLSPRHISWWEKGREQPQDMLW